MMKVNYASQSDLLSIAKCHRSAFSGSLASAFGLRYCSRMLMWYLSSEKQFLLFVMSEGKCVGYCGGMHLDGSHQTGSSSAMLQYSFWSAVWAFLTHPWVIFHSELRPKYVLIGKNIVMRIKRFLFPKATWQKEKPKVVESHLGLIVIGVSPEARGKGVGRMLMEAFEAEARNRQLELVSLSVLKDNLGAQALYERSGWCVEAELGNALAMSKRLGAS